MKIASVLLALVLYVGVSCEATDELIGELIEIPVRETEVNLAARESGGNGAANDDGSDTETYLRILNKLEDTQAESGDRVQFRCRVEANPSQNLTYTWYHGNNVLENGIRRKSIKTRGTSSRLTFSQVYTSDSGDYRCEVSNGILRVSSEAHLDVRFKIPPPASGDEDDSMKLPPNKCELYMGTTCQQYLGGKIVFIDGFSNQAQIEEDLARAALILKNPDLISSSCQLFALPALCYYMFPVCEDGKTDSKAEDRSKPLCREDCEVLKFDVCKNDFANPSDPMKKIAETANCNHLPKATSISNCLQVQDLPRSVNADHHCYNDSGLEYLGMQFKTSVGNICKTWPTSMVATYKELAGGHNYCRNPGEKEDLPWCFVDDARKVRQTCNIAKCSSKDTGSSLLTILIPSVAIPLLIALIALVFCICRRSKSKPPADTKVINERSNPSNPNYEITPFLATKFIVPELNPNTIVYKEDLGEGQYGKVYKGQILQNPNFMSNFPVAVKTFNVAESSRIGEFQREIEVFSALQHPNVACLKAFVCKPNMRCLVFEYTNSIDLHEMLNMHSPNSDFSAKIGSSASSQTSGTLDHGDFINMAIQISSGMDFLSSNNFVHRDLAARNVLVCQNTTLKICNLGVVRDCYLASYYRSPQMGEMLPLRWMSPEAIQFSQFSEKSAVWSFGVLLWEMFSFGLQPYCGFSNQEVLEMIPTQRLLGCPDQCPARVYSLMRECWSHNASARPSFKEILSKLSTWQGASSTSMTSQLARGIHRQLNGMMSDGYNGQYAMSDTAPSFSTASVESPPRYNLVQNMQQDQRMTSGSESFAPPSYPSTSHFPRNQPHELIVDMPPPNQMQQNYYQKPAGFDVHSGASNSECEVKTPGYYTQSQFNKPRIPRHSSVSSRSTASAGSAREQRQHEIIQNKLRNTNAIYNKDTDNVFLPRQNTADEFSNMQHPNNQQVPSATVQPYSVNFNQQNPPNQPHDIVKPDKDTTGGIDGDVSSSSSDQAISCDSGLPAEDHFSHLTSTNSRYPLLGPKPYTNPSSPNKTTP